MKMQCFLPYYSNDTVKYHQIKVLTTIQTIVHKMLLHFFFEVNVSKQLVITLLALVEFILVDSIIHRV